MTRSGAFPSSASFPLGRALGVISGSVPQRASRVRPFGLTLAAEPQPGVRLDPREISYDSVRQIGLVRDGDLLVPLSKHSTGTTSSVTDGGDGASKESARDSDTDATED